MGFVGTWNYTATDSINLVYPNLGSNEWESTGNPKPGGWQELKSSVD